MSPGQSPVSSSQPSPKALAMVVPAAGEIPPPLATPMLPITIRFPPFTLSPWLVLESTYHGRLLGPEPGQQYRLCGTGRYRAG